MAACRSGVPPEYVIVTPDGKRVYTGNYTGNSISGFAAGTDGSLTALSGLPFGRHRSLRGNGGERRRHALYVSSFDDGKVVPLAIAADGALLSAGTRSQPATQTTGRRDLPDGKNVYAAALGSKQLFAFSVGPAAASPRTGPRRR